MERIVDIATDGRHLSSFRGFLVVSENKDEVGRIPLDDVAAVIVHAHGVTWSTNLMVALAERGALMVLCPRVYRIRDRGLAATPIRTAVRPAEVYRVRDRGLAVAFHAKGTCRVTAFA